jgi:hypothetical protein
MKESQSAILWEIEFSCSSKNFVITLTKMNRRVSQAAARKWQQCDGPLSSAQRHQKEQAR